MKKIIVVLAFVLMFVRPAHAQFGIFCGGVYNPCNATTNPDGGYWGMAMEWEQKVQQLLAAQQQSQMMVQQAQAIKSLPQQFPQAFVALWQSFNPLRACPACGVVTQGANTGTPFPDTMLGGAVSKLQDYSRVVSALSPEGQNNFLARLTSGLYLRQAALNNGVTAVGVARQTDAQMRQAVAQCSSNSVNPGYVSSVQVDQSTAACQSVIAQQQSTQNRLLGAIVEHQNIAATEAMQRAADEANAAVYQQEFAGSGQAFSDSLGHLTTMRY